MPVCQMAYRVVAPVLGVVVVAVVTHVVADEGVAVGVAVLQLDGIFL